eukprot:TRINITY_DN2510_c0_g1_i2.p1 TRINITY_DN2510_c0_g1~~TRINITY_DN2510_c0_g1_i2.p1  ORF type:complete len:300 (-),score=96.25 TRINITY_DN2510_c0_g1_i2:41-940(-)
MDAEGKQHKLSANVRGILSGIASGVGKTLAGHPFDTIKVRLQHEGASSRFKGPFDAVIQTVKYEGLTGLYKGVSGPLVGLGFVDAVMIGSYSRAKRFFQEKNLEKKGTSDLSIAQFMAAGGVGGVACSFVICPVEQVTLRLQVQYASAGAERLYRNPLDCAFKIIKKDGPQGLYRGFPATLAFRSICCVYFTAYELSRREFTKLKYLRGPHVGLLSGCCAATAFWSIALPADNIKNRMMAQKDVGGELEYKSVMECVTKVARREGALGFYKGWLPCLLRSLPANASAFFCMELALRFLP